MGGSLRRHRALKKPHGALEKVHRALEKPHATVSSQPGRRHDKTMPKWLGSLFQEWKPFCFRICFETASQVGWGRLFVSVLQFNVRQVSFKLFVRLNFLLRYISGVGFPRKQFGKWHSKGGAVGEGAAKEGGSPYLWGPLKSHVNITRWARVSGIQLSVLNKRDTLERARAHSETELLGGGGHLPYCVRSREGASLAGVYPLLRVPFPLFQVFKSTNCGPGCASHVTPSPTSNTDKILESLTRWPESKRGVAMPMGQWGDGGCLSALCPLPQPPGHRHFTCPLRHAAWLAETINLHRHLVAADSKGTEGLSQQRLTAHMNTAHLNLNLNTVLLKSPRYFWQSVSRSKTTYKAMR